MWKEPALLGFWRFATSNPGVSSEVDRDPINAPLTQRTILTLDFRNYFDDEQWALKGPIPEVLYEKLRNLLSTCALESYGLHIERRPSLDVPVIVWYDHNGEPVIEFKPLFSKVIMPSADDLKSIEIDPIMQKEIREHPEQP